MLISTPRRFGKTIAVSMFAAAILYSAAQVEVSIYSTCKRISQKLLRNVCKFLSLIYEGAGREPMRVVRCNMEELVVQGPEGSQDQRVVNSYPSKVTLPPLCVVYVYVCQGAGTHAGSVQPVKVLSTGRYPALHAHAHPAVYSACSSGMLLLEQVS